jgi:anti-sigma B factor antagonist
VALNTTTSRANGVVVVHLHGSVFFGEESVCLRSLVKELLNESRQLVFDLGNVTHIDSGGVGILVAAFATARNAGGTIKFANLGKHTREVLQTTNLVTVFEIFGETRDAVASFTKDATNHTSKRQRA